MRNNEMKMRQIILTAAAFTLVVMLCACNGGSPAATPTASEPIHVQESGSSPAQMLSVEQAMEILYEKHGDAEMFHQGELDKWEGETLIFGFDYDDGVTEIRYAYVNSMTGEVEFGYGVVDYSDALNWWGDFSNADGTLKMVIFNFDGESFIFMIASEDGRLFDGIASVDEYMAYHLDLILALNEPENEISIWMDGEMDDSDDRVWLQDTYFREES